MNKILKCLIVFIILTSTLSVVNASDINMLEILNITAFEEDTEVLIDDMYFTIPAGWGEYVDVRSDGELDEIEGLTWVHNMYIYYNESGDTILISVNYDLDQSIDSSIITPDSENKEEITIANKEGILEKDSEDNNITFEYAEDGKQVIICAPSQNILENILGA